MISLDLILLVAGQVFTLFLLMAVGFILAKGGKLSSDSCSQMSHLLMYMVMPCTTISALQQNPYSPELARVVLMTFLASALCYAAYILLTGPLFRRRSPDERDVLRFSVIYGNTGFMGLPLVMGIFGAESVIYCAIYGTMFSISSWTRFSPQASTPALIASRTCSAPLVLVAASSLTDPSGRPARTSALTISSRILATLSAIEFIFPSPFVHKAGPQQA